jgi:hypothetical protein
MERPPIEARQSLDMIRHRQLQDAITKAALLKESLLSQKTEHDREISEREALLEAAEAEREQLMGVDDEHALREMLVTREHVIQTEIAELQKITKVLEDAVVALEKEITMLQEAQTVRFAVAPDTSKQ